MVDLAPANFPTRYGQVWQEDFRVTGGKNTHLPHILFRTSSVGKGIRLNDPAGTSGLIRSSALPYLRASNFKVEVRMRLAGSPSAGTALQFCIRRAIVGDYSNRI